MQIILLGFLIVETSQLCSANNYIIIIIVENINTPSLSEETSALTKAKAMLKFREFQKKVEQRERAGKGKANVTDMFDSTGNFILTNLYI